MRELLVLERQSKVLAVPHGDGAAATGLSLQPMENKCLQYQLGIGQVPGTILFKGFKEFGIKPIGSLDGQGFADDPGGLYWFVSFGHSHKVYLAIGRWASGI